MNTAHSCFYLGPSISPLIVSAQRELTLGPRSKQQWAILTLILWFE